MPANSFPTPAFWGWGFSPKDDLNEQLNRAIDLYQARQGKRPLLVFCGKGVKPFPVDGLRIEQRSFVPVHAFYFALNNH